MNMKAWWDESRLLWHMVGYVLIDSMFGHIRTSGGLSITANTIPVTPIVFAL